jgi:hypothetical protein
MACAWIEEKNCGSSDIQSDSWILEITVADDL